jgi:hypothetical protein
MVEVEVEASQNAADVVAQIGESLEHGRRQVTVLDRRVEQKKLVATELGLQYLQQISISHPMLDSVR